MEMEHDMGGARGGLRGFDGVVEEEERGLLECSVCGAGSTTGLHYGATTCYPCRAFFRRIPERKRPPRCKRQGTCSVEAMVTKHCPGCRFQKCLRAGMQLSQVLTEEQRRERFASSMRRKRAAEERQVESDSSPVEEQRPRLLTTWQEEQQEELRPPLATPWQQEEELRQGEEMEAGPLEDQGQGEPSHDMGDNQHGVEQTNSQPGNHERLNRQESHFLRTGRGEDCRWSSPRPSPLMPDGAPLNMTLASFLRGNTEQTHQPVLDLSRNLVEPWPLLYSSSLAAFSHSTLSPLMPKLARIQSTRPPHNFCPPESLDDRSHRGMHKPFDFAFNNYKNLPQPLYPNFLPPNVRTGHTEKRLSPHTEPHKRPSVIQNFKKDGKLQSNEVSSIPGRVQPGGPMSEELQGQGIGKNLDETCFGRADDPVAAFITKDEDPEEIQMINKYLHKKFDRSMLKCLESEEPRSSVIVKPSTSKPTPTTPPAHSKQMLLLAKQKVDLLDENLVDVYDEIDFSDKDLEDIKAFCLTTRPSLEDSTMMRERERSYYETWYATNVGEKLMASFVDFARNGSQLTFSFEIMKAKQYKQRYVSSVCTLDLTDTLAKDVLLRVLRERIEMTGLLTWLTIFNLEPDRVPHFVLSDADKRQWMETAGDVQWPTSNRVLQFLPGSVQTKLEILNHMKKHEAAILADKSVHMLMSLLCLFDSEDSDEHVRTLHGSVLSLLRGHIYSTCQNPQFHLEKVMESVKSLPALASLRHKLLTEALHSGQRGPGGTLLAGPKNLRSAVTKF